jgi:hypothetical protein
MAGRTKYKRKKKDRSIYHITKFVFRFEGERPRSLKINMDNENYNENILNILSEGPTLEVEKNLDNDGIKQSWKDMIKYVQMISEKGGISAI